MISWFNSSFGYEIGVRVLGDFVDSELFLLYSCKLMMVLAISSLYNYYIVDCMNKFHENWMEFVSWWFSDLGFSHECSSCSWWIGEWFDVYDAPRWYIYA